MERKYLIVPDVHGRTFWKTPVTEWLNDTDEKVIFLGDYVDPYPHEGITSEDAIESFKDVLKLKESFGDRIILLFGNHDFHYVIKGCDSSRMDRKNYDELRKLFSEHSEWFKLAHFDEICGKNVIFSHAGINPYWIDYNFEILSKGHTITCESVDSVNYEMIKAMFGGLTLKDLSGNSEMCRALFQISCFRWGSDKYSSIIWCDVNELMLDSKKLDAVQIFGHTQRQSEPVRNGDDYDLDCRRCFYLTDECVVLDSLTGDEVKDNGESEMNAYKERLKLQMSLFL